MPRRERCCRSGCPGFLLRLAGGAGRMLRMVRPRTEPADTAPAGRRSPAMLRYGWAVAVSGLLASEFLFSCDRPLHPLVLSFLSAAGLERAECTAPQGSNSPGS